MFGKFRNTHGLPDTVPISASVLALFISHLHRAGYSPATVSLHISAIGYIHKLQGGNDPTTTFLVQKLLFACHKLSKQFDLRMPIDKPMLSRLLGALDFTVSGTFLRHFTVSGKHHRALYEAMFCLAFYAFLRIGEMTVQSANATNPNLLQWKQLKSKDTSLTVTSIHFKHSKGKPLTLTIKGTTSPQDCPLQIMKAYLSVRGATAGPLFLYCPSVPVTCAKFNEQLRGALQFCHFCPKQFKSHSFRIGAATIAAAQGMSDSQIRSLGRWSSDTFMKYIRCSQRVSAL